MATLGELVVSLSANTAQFTSAMDKAAFTTQKRMDQMLASANQLGAALGTTLAASALAVAAGIKLTVDRMDDLGKNAQRLGMTTEALSGLEYAAEMSGVSVEELHASISRLNKAMGDGSPAFDAMGISIKGANGALKSSDEVLAEVAEKFAGYRDGAEKSALAMEIFGKSGAGLVPLLNSGSEGLAQMADEAARFGIVVGKDTTDAAAAFNDNLTRVAKTQEGLVAQLTAALLPTLERASNEFVDLARNTDLVSTPAAILKTIFQTLAVVGSDVAFVLKMTGNEIGGIAAQLAALGTGDFKGFSAIGEMMKADAAAARAELDAFQARIMGIGEVAVTEAKKVEQGGGLAAPLVKAAEKAKRAKKELDDLLTPAAQVYAKAIEQMAAAQRSAERSAMDLDGAQQSLHDLMADPLWQQMPEPWQKTAIAQAQSASAMIAVADRQKRINDMLAATPTAKLAESRAAMMLLKEEFEAGEISAEEFSEAAGTHLGTLPQAAEQVASKIDIVIANAFDGAASAIADFAMGGKASFSDMVKSMLHDLIKLQAQMAMTEAFKSVGGSSGILGAIGGFVGSLFGGGTTAAAGNTTPGFSAGDLGSGISLAGTRASGGYVAAGDTYLVGESGPELLTMGGRSGNIVPNSAIGGANVTVNVINNGDGQARSERRNDGRGGMIIDVIVERAKNAIAADIGNGSGAVPAALQGAYGLNRAAGAY